MPATLYVVATPIGNLEDITLRALRILRDEVAVIACEDTRQTQKLLDHFRIHKRLISYHDYNETSRAKEILQSLESGESVAVVSDAGTPLISDPGYRVTQEAIQGGFPVVPIPGASAALAALAAAGLPTDEFRFIGFLPPKANARRKLFEDLAHERATVVAYESPHRIAESLHDLAEISPSRPIVIARELTKIHEEFLRGSAIQVRDQLAQKASIRGEFTLVMGRLESADTIADPAFEIDRLQREEGLDRMEAIKTVAKRLHLPKREVYRLSAGRTRAAQASAEQDNNPRGKHRG